MFDARDGEFNLENVKGQLCIPVNLFTIPFFFEKPSCHCTLLEK